MDERIERLFAAFPPRLSAELRRMGEGESGFLSRLSEIRLREGRLASVTVAGRAVSLPVLMGSVELADTFRRLCGDAIYLHEGSLREGYFSFHGIRIGVAGRAVVEGGTMVGLASPTSLCIRIPHSVSGAGALGARLFFAHGRRGMLIYSPPGVGKTTFLSDLARRLATATPPLSVALIDTRGELYDGAATPPTAHLDVLRDYPIAEGVLQATRNLSPDVILCDELARPEEADAILSRAGCGVPIIASAHAGDPEELFRRPPLARLLAAGVFSTLIGITRTDAGYAYRAEKIEGEGKRCSVSLAPCV